MNLPAGSQITYTINATLAEPGAAHQAAEAILTNVARVEAPAGFVDVDPSNNHDAESDIVVLAASGGMGVFLNSGQMLGDGNSLPSALGDVDGDGDLDALVVNYDIGNPDKGQSVLWINSGDGAFTEGDTLLPGGLSLQKSREVELGDLDGDGDLDAFIINTFADHYVWFNDGHGNFTEHQSLPNTNNVRGLELGDIDGDGDLDAVVAYESTAVNEIWINQAGTFTLSART